MSDEKRIVINGSGLILGRLASRVAKFLLLGDEVTIVNAENIVTSKSKSNAVAWTKAQLQVRTLGSQSKAPKHPRTVENIVRRTVRGMLPWKKPRGKIAYKRLKVYKGIPEKLKDHQIQELPRARPVNTKRYHMTVEEHARILG